MNYILKYKRLPINLDGKLVNLTDMWKAVGSPHHKKPTLWRQKKSSIEFISSLRRQLGVSKSTLLKSVLGRGLIQGTYAHWQIALAYAEYLSPEFHIWANEKLKQLFEGDIRLAEEVVDRNQNPEDLERLALRAASKSTNLRLREEVGNAMKRGKELDMRVMAYVNYDVTLASTGMTPKQVRQTRGVKQTRDGFTPSELAATTLYQEVIADGLSSRKVKGGQAVLKVKDEVIQDFTKLRRKYGKAI